MSEELKAVLVTTAHRGVFFGYLASEVRKSHIKLTGARNCVAWSADVKGFGGLAATGPTSDCRIGPSIGTITLFDITSVSECSADAVKAWETAPWR